MSISKIFADISKQCATLSENTKDKKITESLIKATKDTKKSINKYLDKGIEEMEKYLSKEKQKERAEKVQAFAQKAGATAYKAPKGIGRGFASFIKPFKEGWEEEMKK